MLPKVGGPMFFPYTGEKWGGPNFKNILNHSRASDHPRKTPICVQCLFNGLLFGRVLAYWQQLCEGKARKAWRQEDRPGFLQRSSFRTLI